MYSPTALLQFCVHAHSTSILVRQLLTLSLYSSSEHKFGVQAHAIAVDFAEGEFVFDKIRDELQDKEVGILGKSGLHDHAELEYYEYRILPNKRAGRGRRKRTLNLV